MDSLKSAKIHLDRNAPRTCFLLGVTLYGGDWRAAARSMLTDEQKASIDTESTKNEEVKRG